MTATNKKNQYSIKIYYDDDSVRTLETLNNFQRAKDLYNAVKEEYLKNKKVISIQLHIIHPNGKVTKHYRKDQECDEHEKFIKTNINSDVRDVVGEIKMRFELLMRQKEYYHDKIIECERRRNELLHMIGATKNKEFETDKDKQNYKLKLFDELELNEQQRRKAKNNHNDLTNMFYNISFGDMYKDIDKWDKERKPVIETPEDFSKKVRRVETYTTNKEKEKYIKKYSNNYDKVEWYKKDKKLIFIGHVGMGKRNYKNKPFEIVEKEFYI